MSSFDDKADKSTQMYRYTTSFGAAVERTKGPAARERSSSAAGHGRQNDQRIAVAHGGVQAVEHTHVLIVEVDVDVAV